MGISRTIRSIFESGIQLTFTVSNVKKLRKRGNNIWRAQCDLKIVYTYEGNEVSVDFEKVRCSRLASFNLLTKAENFVEKEFTSFSTSQIWKDNPFKLVKSENEYFLYMVHEKGRKYYDQTMPGGQVITKCVFEYYEPKDYVRYLDCDMLKEYKLQKEQKNG